MTANQRRPGFRLPWSSEMDETVDGSTHPAAGGAVADAPAALSAPATDRPDAADPPAGEGPQVVPPAAEAAPMNDESGSSADFMRELVAAMRRVADEAREAGVADMRSRVEEHVKRVEAAAEARRTELNAQAERDIAGVGEWAQAEAARIRREADEKVVARRAKLEEQMAADAMRTRNEAGAVRERAAAYEKELDTYHAQLVEIDDPTAFAAAAKRMPQPPPLEGVDAPAAATPSPMEPPVADGAPVDVPTPAPAATPPPPQATAPEAVAPERPAPAVDDAAPAADVHPAEELLGDEVAEIESAPAATASAPAPAPRVEPVTTDIIVKGLGSFGAITGFRQTLAGAEGIEGVALSLGQTGEFVFRATHQPGVDIAAVIRGLEGDGARIELQGESALQVTLDRAR
jgi:hypothetical protein